jgi:hypothetical protein
MAKNEPDQYSEKEAKERLEKALRAALNTPPKPLKSIPKKRAKTQPIPKKSP